MKLKSYPVLRILLFFLAGLLLPSIDSNILLISGVLAIILIIIGLFKKNIAVLSVSFWMLIAVCGNGLKTFDNYSKTGLSDIEQIDAYLIQIDSSPEKKPKSYKALAQVIRVEKDSVWAKSDAKTLLYFNLSSGIEPKYGEQYLIVGKPREIEGPKNPEEFDYKAFQAQKGILTHHFLREGDAQLIGMGKVNPLYSFAYYLNDYAKAIYEKFIISKENKAVANAMIIGLKDELGTELRDSYATAGAIHILAVSGLHVGILFLLLSFIFGWLKKLPKGELYFSIIVIGILWLYALFTGLSPSVTRSTLMFTIFQVGMVINRDKNSINTIAFSALILLILNPSWIFEVGFQLSYLAIFGIVYLFPYLNKLWQPSNFLVRKLWQISIVSVSAQLLTFPLSIYYFHQFPNYFLLTNPIVTVLSTIILFAGILLLFFAQIPLLNSLTAWIFDISLSLLNYAVKAIESLPNSKSAGFYLEKYEVVILYALLFFAVIFFVKKHPINFKIASVLAIGLCSIFIWKQYQTSKQKGLTFHFIPKSGGISVIDQNKVTFIADGSTIEDSRMYGFHLKNYYDKLGVSNVKFQKLDSALTHQTIKVGNEELLWVRQKGRGTVPASFEKVLISHNSVYSLAQTFEVLPKTVILDDSNSSYAVQRLKAEADSIGVELIALYETGGVNFDLTK